MDFVEAKGKTVDEAIFKGLEEMGLSRLRSISFRREARAF